jgi:hypothetical protein
MKTIFFLVLVFIPLFHEEAKSQQKIFSVDMTSFVLTTGAIVCLLGKFKGLDILCYIGQWYTGKNDVFYFSLENGNFIRKLQIYCGYASFLLIAFVLILNTAALSWQKGEIAVL